MRCREQYFMAVVKFRSFSAAAKKLYVSQPAISRQIAQFEKELGLPLFDRDTHSVSLTPYGEILYEALLENEKNWQKALLAAHTAGSQSKELRVGMLGGWSTRQPPVTTIIDFGRRHPDINLSIQQYTFREIVDHLADRRLDLVLSLDGEVPERVEFITCSAATVNLVMYIASNHPLSEYDEINEHFRGLKVFVLDETASRLSLERVGGIIAERNWKMEIIPMPNIDSIYSSVEQGQGVAFTYQNARVWGSPLFKTYTFEQQNDLIYAWNVNNYNLPLHLFITEHQLMDKVAKRNDEKAHL